MTTTAVMLAVLVVVLLILAVVLARRRRKDYILSTEIARWIRSWRNDVLEEDKERFDNILRAHLGEPLDDLAGRIDLAPKKNVVSLPQKLMELHYLRDCAKALMAANKADAPGSDAPQPKPHPERFGIEDMRENVINADREDFETVLKEFFGEPLGDIHEKLDRLPGQELANLYIRLMECRYNHKEEPKPATPSAPQV